MSLEMIENLTGEVFCAITGTKIATVDCNDECNYHDSKVPTTFSGANGQEDKELNVISCQHPAFD